MAAVLDLTREQVSLTETGRRALSLRESALLKQAYGLSMETLLAAAGPTSKEAIAILQSLSEEDQQEVAELVYRGMRLLAARRQQQQGEQEHGQQEA